MELNLEYEGLTVTISSDFPVNLAGLQAFLDAMFDVEVIELEDDEADYE